MSEEWGPWIEHDGSGCPVPRGTIVHVVFDRIGLFGMNYGRWLDGRREWIGPANLNGGSSWDWGAGGNQIIRYRVKKPKGLTILENLIADIPQPVEVGG